MRIVITAGGTREYIDPVRFISNASSGRMGYALARAALNAGHKVTLITAPTAQKPPNATKIVNVETAAQMFEAVKKHFSRCDCLMMSAAVADYTPVRKAAHKIKKAEGKLVITLKPTKDILQWAGRHKKEGQILVGFALESENLRRNAGEKLKAKNLDMIIANSPSAIERERSAVHVNVRGRPWMEFPPASKAVIARRLVRQISYLVSRIP
ncbi:MAG: phosphopantothenoylcysteine decarboxylase domain-containing protein [Planctomycetota bacterium]|jgi:phosphopantothenoylcysteine decarboxylase/phosphopantothenate--cysteine ligase